MTKLWHGVLPAVTTQFKEDFSLDLEASQTVMENLIRDGVDGLVICGTVGEGCSLTSEEKRLIIKAAVEAADKRVPVIVGVAEYTTQMAANLARDAEKLGADALMVLPAMVYQAKPHETIAHFNSVARASDLPIMIYNNPPAYKIDITPDMAVRLAEIDTIEAIKDSSGDTRRLVDMRRALKDRLTLLCGLDDVVLESVAVGAVGWVSGMSNVFPKEGARLFDLCRQGDFEKARPLYEWFMPLLHLDARPDLVQCIKLCEEIAGRGSSITRPPRLPLTPEERREVENIMKQAMDNRVKV